MATQQVVEMSKVDSILESRGISRRSFLKYCAGVAAMIGLSEVAAPQIASALESVIGEGPGWPQARDLARGFVVHGLHRVLCSG